MGFSKVYKSLQELFPKIDGRILRAVAIEHSKDVHEAIGVVLDEIIPFLTERTRPSSPMTGSISVGESSGVSLGSVVSNEPYLNVADSTQEENIQASNLKLIGDHSMLEEQTGRGSLQTELSGGHETEETSSADKFPESCIKTLSDNMTCHTLEPLQNVGGDANKSTSLNEENKDSDEHLENGFSMSTNQEMDQAKFVADEKNSVDSQTLSTSSVQLVKLPDIHAVNVENIEVSLSSDAASKMDAPGNILRSEEDSTSNSTLSQSRQIYIINIIEEIIADARNNKKTLFSAMESVMDLLREVENKEQAAEQAKQESSMGGADIRDKIEELDKMLKHAKTANDMHAGEVHGEKAILVTELRELQSRVLSLSDERDKSLVVLDEMRRTLEVRLTVAENEIKSAEEKKLEKENLARKAFADQELIMEKVVQESNILKQQAEENTKLQEFLVDRSRVVDILQGEIAVICEDVRLLKEKFDLYVSFRESVSSSQTSCILASSGSSLKGSIPDHVGLITDQDDLFASFEEVMVFEDEAARNDRKALLDDGWDIFEDEFRSISS